MRKFFFLFTLFIIFCNESKTETADATLNQTNDIVTENTEVASAKTDTISNDEHLILDMEKERGVI